MDKYDKNDGSIDWSKRHDFVSVLGAIWAPNKIFNFSYIFLMGFQFQLHFPDGALAQEQVLITTLRGGSVPGVPTQ